MAPPSSSDRWLELSVLDVLSRWPASARLFLRYRMACIGCDFSRFDRVGEALAVHGLDPQVFLEGLAAVADPDRDTLAQGEPS